MTEHRRTIERIRNERKLPERSFESFETVIPEAIGVSVALSRHGTFPTFTNKWGGNLIPLLGELAEETKEALNGA